MHVHVLKHFQMVAGALPYVDVFGNSITDVSEPELKEGLWGHCCYSDQPEKQNSLRKAIVSSKTFNL